MIAKIINVAKRLVKPAAANAAPAEINFGIKTGANTVIGPPLRIDGKQYIEIGDNCLVGANVWMGAYDYYPYSNQHFTPQIIIGNDVFIGDNVIITAIDKVIIETGVEMSHNIFISDHTHSTVPVENMPIRKRKLISTGYVKIGAYTAIGIRAVICQGVTLGKYCVVSANSLVTRSFPDYSLIRGNPAVLVKIFSVEKGKWVEPDEAMKQKYNSV
jgi:acetyltransferase-like isoleucine patch superfamily enzyme